MTDQTPITPSAAFKVTRTSDFGGPFPHFLFASLTAYIAAERDLEDVQGAFDPAYISYERDADLARERLWTAISQGLTFKATTVTDRPLLRMVIVIAALIQAEDVGTFKSLHRYMHLAFDRQFQIRGTSLKARFINAQMRHARDLVDALVALPLFDRWSEEELAIYNRPAPDQTPPNGF